MVSQGKLLLQCVCVKNVLLWLYIYTSCSQLGGRGDDSGVQMSMSYKAHQLTFDGNCNS